MRGFIFLAISCIVAPVKGQTACIFTLEQLITLEEAVVDYSVGREYVICEGREFEIGTYDINNDFVEVSGTYPPFPLRPNMLVKCGDSGARENNCLVTGGDVQVDATNYLGTSKDLDVANVTIQGFTFVGANRHSVWANKPGDITFIDCLWKEIKEAYAPIFFDFYDPTNLQTSLDVKFISCRFEQIIFYGDGAYPAIITANGDQNHLSIDRCEFDSNDYIFNNTQYATNSYLIESSGDLTLTLNCFTNNTLGVSMAVAYGVALTSGDNFGSTSDGGTCAFLANFETAAELDAFTPTCTAYEATVCLSDTTGMPSASPSGHPTTSFPSNFPSAPTASPSGSALPSLLPSSSPTAEPTTNEPSNNDPSAFPSESLTTDKPTTMNPTLSTTSGDSHSLVAFQALIFGTFGAAALLL